jgi:membrane protease YdiL (CAAX protease family)
METAGNARAAEPMGATAAPSRPTERTALTRTTERHGLLLFSLIAYAITWTLLVVGYLGVEAGLIDPEGAYVGIATMVAPAGPLIAALVVLGASRGRAGLAGLGRSMVRWRVHPLWYAYVFLGVPMLMITAVSLFSGVETLGALAEQSGMVLSQVPLGILSIAVFTGIPEEPGWRGYAQPWANRRYRPLIAALVVSVIWSLWHLPNILFGGTPVDTALHLMATVISGIILAWIYNSTGGSVFIAMLAHGANNAMAGLFTHALSDTAAAVGIAEYYVISMVANGLLVLVIVALTRGRLGLAPEDGARPPR